MQTIQWKNIDNGRYYIVSTYQDLLKDFIVATANGGAKKKHNSFKVVHASKDIDSQIKKLKQITRTRKQHGYE
jgi:hypothetical protein